MFLYTWKYAVTYQDCKNHIRISSYCPEDDSMSLIVLQDGLKLGWDVPVSRCVTVNSSGSCLGHGSKRERFEDVVGRSNRWLFCRESDN